MVSPPSPEIKPPKNLWLIIKIDVYKYGKLYSRKEGLWETVKTAASKVKVAIVEKLIKSLDER